MSMGDNNHTDSAITLLEDALPSPLKVVESNPDPNSHILCTLDGPCMSYTVPTRNTRLYTEDLCDSIFQGEYVAEMIATNNFFGEPSHPMEPENRLDLYYPYVSHRIRNIRKVPSEGCYYCTVDIIDTPYGRILKTLVDLGAKLGISSRGSGKTITRQGKIIVDPSTYTFITLDLVHMPGLKLARMSKLNPEDPNFAELKKNESLVTKLTNQINECIKSNNKQLLESIKPLFEYLDTTDPEIGKLQETVDTKLSDRLDDTKVSSTVDDLVEAYSQVSELKSELSNKDSIIDKLQGKLNEAMQMSSVNETGIELPKVMSKLNNSMKIIKAQQDKINSLTKANTSLSDNLDTISLSMKSLRQKYHELQLDRDTDNSNASELQSELNEKISELSTKVRDLRSSINSYKSSNKEKDDQINELLESINDLQSKLSVTSGKADRLQSSLVNRESKLHEVTQRYFSCRCSQLGLNESLVMNTAQTAIDNYDLDAIETIVTNAYNSRKMISRESPRPLVDSLTTKRMNGRLDESITRSSERVEHPSVISDRISPASNDYDALSSICAAVKSGEVKRNM